MKIVTLSTETPEEIRAGRERHSFGATMLSDPQLEAIDRFGLRDPDASGPAGKPLPVPTALLVDAAGTVVWKDQAENFQERSEADDVLAAVKAHVAPSG